ncbi:MBL fold metallo-hydrolase [Pimelobacter simplex]|uniref:MBL fold metallo-hydrolase n=1 Tax=Nocardioides simplex TaxID=2045 RepID=UPI0019322DA3|nr:MBL fold metallo-hydrolase [Pimelobacter simplex]
MLSLTHIGGPTVLIELDGWRILTDPTFDEAGRTYGFGLGTSSTKTQGPVPAIADIDLDSIDVVLVSHDHHADNLDDLGRTVFPRAGTVLTTLAGQRRLGGKNTRGLRAGDVTTLTAPGRTPLRVSATPCRHGPPLSRPLVGPVIGFALSLDGHERADLWMTGDTVLHRALLRTARRLDVDVLLMHLGSVQFPITGRVRYSMNASDALKLTRTVQPRIAVPVHYEGWSHFHQPTSELRSTIASADQTSQSQIRWLTRGVSTPM